VRSITRKLSTPSRSRASTTRLEISRQGTPDQPVLAGVVVFANLSDPPSSIQGGLEPRFSRDWPSLWKTRCSVRIRRSGNVSEREKGGGDPQDAGASPAASGSRSRSLQRSRSKGSWRTTPSRRPTRSAAPSSPRRTPRPDGVSRPEFHRSAWTVALNSSWSDRQSFARWGLDRSTDPSALRPSRRRSTRTSSRGRELQPLRRTDHKEFTSEVPEDPGPGGEMGGRDLDRFSKYAFRHLREQPPGFSGSGVRFTDGTIGHSHLQLQPGDIIRSRPASNQARVGTGSSARTSGTTPGWGSAPFVGPWGTLIQLNVGYALRLDRAGVPGAEGVPPRGPEAFGQTLKPFSATPPCNRATRDKPTGGHR